eukprot:jgi/Tetstr1/454056/TSEL_040975.t1
MGGSMASEAVMAHVGQDAMHDIEGLSMGGGIMGIPGLGGRVAMPASRFSSGGAKPAKKAATPAKKAAKPAKKATKPAKKAAKPAKKAAKPAKKG